MHTEIIARYVGPDILLLSHGITMILAYAVMAPIAVLFARFVKKNVNGRVWFHGHATLVTLVLVAHLTAVTLAYIAVRDLHWTLPHVIAGITTMSLLLFQYPLGVAIAYCTSPNTSETHTLNQVHYATGRMLIPFAVFVTIPLGFVRFVALFPASDGVWAGAVAYAVWVAVGASIFAFFEGWRYGAEPLVLEGGFHVLVEDSEGSEGAEVQEAGGGGGGGDDEVEVVEEFAETFVFARSGEFEEATQKPTQEVGAESASAAGVAENPMTAAAMPESPPALVESSHTLEEMHQGNGNKEIEAGKGPIEAESATELGIGEGSNAHLA
ncbi:hypothetical protein BC830DRAFT_1126209 [Chytriomyces sp. MP71]|nr:hypothetical protein BC830DRAFT_1126209 [Chytriomyces sp. MP71]